MNKILLFLLIVFSAKLYSQNVDNVALITSGNGKTKEEATQKALRSAIEQTYGVFVSSTTKIFNDSLVEDEITTISKGAISSYTILNEAILLDNTITVTLKAFVSFEGLKKIAQNKGNSVSFDGALFGMKIKMANLQIAAELKVVEALCQESKKYLRNSFDYKLTVSEPKKADIIQDLESEFQLFHLSTDAPSISELSALFQYKVSVNVDCIPNKNLDVFIDNFIKTLTAINMNESEIEFSKSSNLDHSSIGFTLFDGQTFQDYNINLRSYESVRYINDYIFNGISSVYNYKIFSNDEIIDYSYNDISKFEKLPIDKENINFDGLNPGSSEFLNSFKYLYKDSNFCFVIKEPLAKISVSKLSQYPQQYWYPDVKNVEDYFDYSDDNQKSQDIMTQNKFNFYRSDSYVNTYDRNIRSQRIEFYMSISDLEKIKEIKIIPLN